MSSLKQELQNPEYYGSEERSLRSVLSPSEGCLSVSVVIPVRNDSVRLARCLQTLSEQDYPPERLEIIVVDNGSQDGSLRVAEQSGATTLSFPGLRVGALRNRGVARSRGELLAFVDSDHEVASNWIRLAASDFQSDPQLTMLGSPCLAPPQGTWVQRAWELHRIRDKKRRNVTWLGAGNMFVRRPDFERVGGFCEDLVAGEDVDLCVRLAQNKGTIVADMRVTNIHHGEPESVWRFFSKECWRGSSGLRAFFAHGMPLHEIPSLAYPMYHLLAVVGLIAGVILALLQETSVPLIAAFLMLVLPSLALALKTSFRSKQPFAVVPLTVLYLTYGMARAVALFR